MNKNFILLLVLITLIPIVSSETVIYDNITQSNYKTITINDDLNYKLITDYKYDVYVNESYIGSYKKDDKIFIPDNSNITIYVPAPISLDYSSAWDLGKTYFAIAIMLIFSLGIGIFFILYFLRKIKRR